jgi:hypothetical protein
MGRPMPGTSEDPSADWPLLYAVRALVARYCSDSLEAERLIIAYANKWHFRRYKFSGGHIDPRHWGACHEELGFYIPVDFERSTVKHVHRPAAEASSYTTRLTLDDLLEPFYGPAYVEMREVRLARDDVLSMLRELSLLPPASAEQPRPGSADAWIDELFPDTWHLLKVEPMHGRIVEEVEKRNKEAKRRDKNAPLMVAPSLTALRAALKKRRKA